MKQQVAVITTGVWPVFSSLKPLNDKLKYQLVITAGGCVHGVTASSSSLQMDVC
jgi:hypothetical protein